MARGILLFLLGLGVGITGTLISRIPGSMNWRGNARWVIALKQGEVAKSIVAAPAGNYEIRLIAQDGPEGRLDFSGGRKPVGEKVSIILREGEREIRQDLDTSMTWKVTGYSPRTSIELLWEKPATSQGSGPGPFGDTLYVVIGRPL